MKKKAKNWKDDFMSKEQYDKLSNLADNVFEKLDRDETKNWEKKYITQIKNLHQETKIKIIDHPLYNYRYESIFYKIFYLITHFKSFIKLCQLEEKEEQIQKKIDDYYYHNNTIPFSFTAEDEICEVCGDTVCSSELHLKNSNS